MCDFRYPYYSFLPDEFGPKRVPYRGNVDDVSVEKVGCYSVGHSGSYTFYWDGKKRYMPGDPLPEGIEWCDPYQHTSSSV